MTTPLALLHGFTQTAASFRPLVDELAAQGIAAEALDLPGHGAGEGPDRLVRGDLWTGADDLVRRTSPGRHRVWLGYSMGARLALHVALAHPEAVSGLILVSGTAGIDGAGERARRRERDAGLANRIESIGVEAFLDEWLAMPMFATLPTDPDRIARRATNTAAGLASSLRRWGTGTMDPPLWDRLAELAAPTLIVVGARDAKFTALGRRMGEAIGSNAGFVSIDDAGHAAHIEQPGTTAAQITRWLGQTQPSRT